MERTKVRGAGRMTAQDVLHYVDQRCQFLERHFRDLPWKSEEGRIKRSFVHGQWVELDRLRTRFRITLLEELKPARKRGAIN